MVDSFIIGQNIKTFRLQQRLRQSDLSKVLNVSTQQIQKYEKGINKIPVESLFILKHFFNRPYEDFFYGQAKPPNNILRETLPKQYSMHPSIIKLQSMDNTPLKTKIYKALDILCS